MIRVGIIGGGQLGRMLALAAARLGIRTHIYGDTRESVAGEVAQGYTCASYDNETELLNFANSVDFITFEFENIPLKCVEFLQQYKPVFPKPMALGITQDRLREKEFLKSNNIKTTKFAGVLPEDNLSKVLNHVGFPCVIKTCCSGYDGKGQYILFSEKERRNIVQPSIVEQLVNFVMEFSVIAVRDLNGKIKFYDPVQNVHVDHILSQTFVPADIDCSVKRKAYDIVKTILTELDYCGVLAVEMFLLEAGDVLLNEIAPRVHNSGHWTIDACYVDQFEQHIRAICNLPLGKTTRHCDAIMTNIIGDEIKKWRSFLHKNVSLHVYGKKYISPGRKMGHMVELFPCNTLISK